MSSRPKFNSPEAIARRFAEGRGQGSGSNYLPWIMIQDFASWGQRRRSYCHINKRAMHTLSRLEHSNVMYAGSDPEVIDLQENFPLDREKSWDISAQLGIKHPQVSRSCPIVMSTDLRITKSQNGKVTYEIWTTKETDALRNWRTLEKLKIDEYYWKSEPNHTWHLKTEATLPTDFLANIAYLRPMLRPGALYGISRENICKVTDSMQLILGTKGEPLAVVAAWCDKQFGLHAGESMLIARHHLAHQIWRIDLRKPITTRQPMLITFP